MFEKVFIVAEAGSNHNGSLDTAREMTWRAAESGADAIKFQDFSLHTLFAVREYAKVLGLEGEGWKEAVRKVAIPPLWHECLASEARKAGIVYFSTPFSIDAADALEPYVPFYKIASCDITFLPLIENIASKGKGVFLSTGASTIEEIDRAIEILNPPSLPFVCLLHCIVLYPAPAASLNLNFIGTLSERYGLPVGFSDHSLGTEAARAAVSKGAKALEKHFTLGREQEGADHSNSLAPGELSSMVKEVRALETMLGPPERVLTEREFEERVYARRGIYAARALKRGEKLTFESVAFLRPCVALGAERADQVLGRTLRTDVGEGAPIVEQMLE